MAISVGIGIEGEKQFKAAISDINKNLAVLSSEMTKVTAAYDANDQSVDALRSKQSVYNKQIAEQKNKIDTLKQALVNSAKEYGENSTQAKNWQIALNKAEAELSKTERALKGTTDQLDRAGEGLDNAEKQTEEFAAGAQKSVSITGILGETMTNLGNKIGIPMDKLKLIPPQAAVAVAADAGITLACTALIKKLIEAGKEAGKFADNILTLSAQTHVSADSLQQYAYYAELVDVSLDTVGSSLGKLTKSMSSASSGTGSQAEAFQKLGVSITDANGNLRNANDVFAETIEALGQVGNETEADALASEIFGRSFQDLNPLVAVGADAMKEFAEEAKRMGSNLSGEALAALGEVNDA
jgi:phage-related tail protein